MQSTDPGSEPTRALDLLPWLIAGLLVVLQFVVHNSAAGSYFNNPDDWYHLALARDVVAGEEGALGELFGGFGVRGFRPVPRLVWVVGWIVFRFDAAGYYWTNVAISGLMSASVFGLAVALARAAGRAERSRGAELLAGGVAVALFTLADTPHQEVFFLSARDDALCTALLCLSVLCWVSGRGLRSSVAAALLLLLACASKPIALVGPLLLLGADLGLGRLPWRERRWRRYVAPALAVLVWAFVARSLLMEGLPSSPTDGAGSGSLGNVLVNLEAAFVTPMRSVPAANGARLALLGVVVLAGLAALAARPRLLGFGLFWVALNLVAVWALLAGDPTIAQWQGRYLLLPSVGFALAASALVSGPPRWGGLGWA